VIFYNQEINAQAVQDVLLKFSELLVDKGAPNSNYHDLWRKSVDEIINAKPDLVEEVNKLRSIIIQTSAIPRESSLSPNAE